MGSHRSRILLGLALVAAPFLLAGETPPDDPRFASPSAAVRAFWQAVAEEAPGAALECFVGVGPDAAARRFLQLPSLEELELRAIRVERTGTGVAVVQYQVHYRMRGAHRSGTFTTADELLRVRGQWKIARPLSPSRAAPRGPTPRRPEVRVSPGPEYA